MARRLGLAYAVLILINILPPLAAGGFLSAGRFSAVLFPSFIWLASVIPVRQRWAWLSAFIAIQEQLGLKLESAKGKGEFLVIDHVERPDEN